MIEAKTGTNTQAGLAVESATVDIPILTMFHSSVHPVSVFSPPKAHGVISKLHLKLRI